MRKLFKNQVEFKNGKIQIICMYVHNLGNYLTLRLSAVKIITRQQ